MTSEATQQKHTSSVNTWLDKPVFKAWPSFSIEKLILVLIIMLAVVSRFYDLGERVMAHDEVNHVVPSFELYQGRGYRYDPVTHGPFQFHMIAASYFIFGDSDFSSRIPAAVFGIGVVLIALFAWRRYLGRIGSLIAGLFFLLSPYMLFYSRYTRNEIFIVFWGSVMLWLFLKYLECGEKKYLIFLTIITAMHYTDKATSYIFTAEALILLALLFIAQMLKLKWKGEHLKIMFLILAIIAIVSGTVGFVFSIKQSEATQDMALAGAQQGMAAGFFQPRTLMLIGFIVALIAIITALVVLVLGAGFTNIRKNRSFDLLILQISLVLPLLSAAIINLIGFDPMDYTQSGMLRSALVIVPLGLLSILIGLLWNKKVWIKCAIIFWSIFTIFYTTFFTQGDGFFVGLMGALGYWMSQQAVQRGTQPLYYYALVQIPIYEFLPALGTILAFIVGLARNLFVSKSGEPFSPQEVNEELVLEYQETPEGLSSSEDLGLESGEPGIDPEISESLITPPRKFRLFSDPPDNSGENQPVPTLIMLLFWSLISLVAFSLAGERMPWLTTHIAMPLILTASFGIGYLVETTRWKEMVQKRGLLVFLLGMVFIIALSSALGSLFGSNPPFKGKELTQLASTSTFLLAGVVSLICAGGLVVLLRDWQPGDLSRLLLLSFFSILTLITFRTSFRASFINYDFAKEFLVYAHATRDPKDILEQVETISKRLYGNKDIPVAYDNDSLYPYWWYFRDYPNRKWYSDTPTKELRDSPVILVGIDNFAKIEPVVSDLFYRFDYKRMWWPIEDYDNLTFERVWNDIKNADMREALWDIWFHRDYTKYAEVTGRTNLTLSTWSPSSEMRMYIRKDIAAQIWEYGIAPTPEEPKVDPYEQGTINLDADMLLNIFDGTPLSGPRAVAVSPDNSIYVSDTNNHRILHISPDGTLLQAWGGFADVLNGPAPAGLFNYPSGIAISKEGFVYVADTWNHRIQKFTASGKFVTMWDQFGSEEFPDSFWGPRGIAVDKLGRVYVTDTGKQRVVIFDGNGNYLTQFGSVGLAAGLFDEPVGIAVDDNGFVYVADTWNNRVQIMQPTTDLLYYSSFQTWEVNAWNSQSLDNKPFLALDSQNRVFITDPDLGRILEFDQNGNFLQLWGGYDNSTPIGIASGIAVDKDDHVWVLDALNNSLLRFTVPDKTVELPSNILIPSTGN